MKRINLRSKLSGRIQMEDVQEITYYAQSDDNLRKNLFRLIFDADDQVAYQALWVCTHMTDCELEELCRKQDKLIDSVTHCTHAGKKRLMLSLLAREAFDIPLRIDLLNFCMERMTSQQEPPAIRSLCLKLAHKLTQGTPELQQELRTLLEIMEPELLPPAVRSVRANVLKAMNRLTKKRIHRSKTDLCFYEQFPEFYFAVKTKDERSK